MIKRHAVYPLTVALMAQLCYSRFAFDFALGRHRVILVKTQ